MKYLILLFIAFTFQDIPLKPKDDFEIRLAYEFKNRPGQDINSIHYDETKKEHDRRNSTSVLPFLTLHLKVNKVSDNEVKVRISNNLTSRGSARKVEQGSEFPIVVGFTDDAKDRVSAHHYTITFLSPAKTESSKIDVLIEEDGTFLVNGEKRGKF